MTHKKKKSLSDNISFLLSSTNGKLVNPDEDINTESRARVIDEDELDDDLNDKIVAPSKLRQKNVALLDSIDRKYRGGATSRKDLKDSDSDFDDDEIDDGDLDSHDDDDDKSADIGNEELSGDNSDDDDVGDSEDEAIADLKKKGHESFVSYTDFSGAEEDESGDDLQGDSEEVESGEGTDNEDNSKGNSIEHFSTKDASLEVKKGEAVRNQLNVWDTLMECRIQMQKLVSFSNQFPQANVLPLFQSQGGSNFTSALAKTGNNVTKLLDSLLNLQERLLKQFPETRDLNKTTAKLKAAANDETDEEIVSSEDEKDDEEPAEDEDNVSGSDAEDEELEEELNGNEEAESDDGDSQRESKSESEEETTGQRPHKRRKLSDYSDIIAKNHKEFAPYLNSTIQKWNTKTQVAVGRAGSKNFSGFEQSTLKQIEHILADRHRLIRRTQLRRSDYRILGQVKEKESEAPKEVQSVPDVPVPEEQKNAADSNKEYDAEIFDDTDFYHQLLRELIEKKTADVTDPVQLGRQWIELQKMRSKMKRKVDVKASKGRRLRYSVHPKLVNFMAPQPDLGWSDEAKSELYGSLFGQRKA